MKSIRAGIESVLVAMLVIVIGSIWFTVVFADRIPVRTRIGLFPLSGLETTQILQAMDTYEQEFAQTSVTVLFRGDKTTHTFQELGVMLNKEKTAEKIRSLAKHKIRIEKVQVSPILSFQDEVARGVLQKDFANKMITPQNPALTFDANHVIQVLPAKNGEHIDMVALNIAITEAFLTIPVREVVALAIPAVPQENAEAITGTRIFAQELLISGFHFAAFDRVFDVPVATVASMMYFKNDPMPTVQFDEIKLRAYIAEHIVPQVQTSPVNARFQVEDGKVNQFALPQDGTIVNVDETVQVVQKTLAIRSRTASVAMQIVKPIISDTGDSEKLGIKKLLAVGESDFKGSPKNRIKNIEVGTSRYNGILIAPNEEFSFNAFLGPVNKEAGFAPELVIKNNVTTPEFGGGLCQVSSTVFRAAVNSGMKITSRRNHSYAVRYYGVPGFDATIYPPYTDFRFLNNTPGYILIQTKIDGTKLSFEFWGTDDSRSVVVDGPHPYGKKPDGALRSVLKQTVTKGDQTLIEDTFYSNYKSPNLFPHT